MLGCIPRQVHHVGLQGAPASSAFREPLPFKAYMSLAPPPVTVVGEGGTETSAAAASD